MSSPHIQYLTRCSVDKSDGQLFVAELAECKSSGASSLFFRGVERMGEFMGDIGRLHPLAFGTGTTDDKHLRAVGTVAFRVVEELQAVVMSRYQRLDACTASFEKLKFDSSPLSSSPFPAAGGADVTRSETGGETGLATRETVALALGTSG